MIIMLESKGILYSTDTRKKRVKNMALSISKLPKYVIICLDKAVGVISFETKRNENIILDVCVPFRSVRERE